MDYCSDERGQGSRAEDIQAGWVRQWCCVQPCATTGPHPTPPPLGAGITGTGWPPLGAGITGAGGRWRELVQVVSAPEAHAPRGC